MKAIQIVGGLLLALTALFLGVNLVMPERLQLSESLVIKAPARVIFPYTNSMQIWSTYNPWAQADPEMTHKFSESTSGIGNWMEWESKSQGSGRQEIISSHEPLRVETKLNFVDWEGDNFSSWIIEPQPDGTSKVTMTMEGSVTPLLFRFFNKLMMGELKNSYQKALANLAALTEAAYASEAQYSIEEIQEPELTYLTVGASLNPNQIGQFLGTSFATIGAHMAKLKLEMTAPPAALYLSWTDTLTKMEAAILVPSGTQGSDNIGVRVIPAGKTLKVNYFGDYDKSGAAHFALDDYMLSKGLTMDGPARELYVTDPMTEPDTTKWLTEIYYRVK